MTSRRLVLKLAAAIPAALPVFGIAASVGSTLKYHLVREQVSAAGVQAGTLVLVDTGVSSFTGDGYYLYPDWGRPLVYEVKRRGDRLDFHYPGMGTPLWAMSAAHADARFSGRVEGIVDTDMYPQARLPNPGSNNIRVLEVPELPLA